MTQEEIKEKWTITNAALNELDKKYKEERRILEAETLALCHICQHPNGKHWSDNHPKMSSNYFDCPDCGFHKCTG